MPLNEEDRISMNILEDDDETILTILNTSETGSSIF